MAFRRDKPAEQPKAAKGKDDAWGELWDQLEGPDEDDPGSEAFTEFAASPGAYAKRSALRRKAEPVPPPEPAPSPESLRRGDSADDVRSLLDKVIEEVLPTHAGAPQPALPAFPGEEVPTLRPDDRPQPAPAPVPPPAAVMPPPTAAPPPPTPAPAPRPQVGRETATQLVDPEALAMEHAVGALKPRPASFDRLPDALSDEVKQAARVLRGRPAKDLTHLTDDLSLEAAGTGADFALDEPAAAPAQPSAPVPAPPPPMPAPPLEDEPLELAFDPRRAPRAASVLATPEPAPAHPAEASQPRGRLLIGIAVALLVLLAALVVRTLV